MHRRSCRPRRYPSCERTPFRSATRRRESNRASQEIRLTAVVTTPTAPTYLNGTLVRWANNPGLTATGTFNMVWNDTSTNEDGFRIYEKKVGQDLILLTTVGLT